MCGPDDDRKCHHHTVGKEVIPVNFNVLLKGEQNLQTKCCMLFIYKITHIALWDIH